MLVRMVCCAAVLIFFSTPSISQSADTIIIRNFNTGNYQATSFNYHGIHAKNGDYFFANENGILQYNGSEWRLHRIKDYAGVFSLTETQDDRLYVGSFNEFGYAKPDSTGQYVYTSLRDQISRDSTIGEVWQVVPFNGDVYFQSYDRILRWDGTNLHNLPIKNAYLFPVNDKLYASPFNNNLLLIQGDTTVFVSDKIKYKDDAAFQILPGGPDGKHIIFTNTHGAYLFDDKKNSIEKWEVPANELFEKSYVYSGVFWKDSLYILTTYEKGLILMNRTGEIVNKITKADGLSTNFHREPFIDKRDNVWIASNHGISYVQWPVLNHPKTPPPTIISRVSYNDNEKAIAAPYLSDMEEIPYQSSVVFHFATPGFDNGDLEYSFYLEGQSTRWSGWTNDVKKEYTYLNDGTYTFHVKARLMDGTETQPASLTIHVPGQWYLSYGFISAMAVLFIGFIYGLIKYRTYQLKQHNKQLEDIVNRRTAELVAQREQLQNANKDLRTINTELDNFVYRSSHDLVAPLKSLKGLIHLAKIDNPGNSQMHYLQIMNNSVLRLEDFIKSIMDYSVNTKREVVLQEVRLDSIINDIISELKYFENAHKVDLKKEYDEHFTVKSDFSRLKIIFSNLITNSMKYHNYDQNRPFIKVRAKKCKKGTQIDIIDNGQGIDNQFLNKIFDMFFRASEISDGSGLGLYIVRDTANKLGAEIKVESQLGSGTTFSLLVNN